MKISVTTILLVLAFAAGLLKSQDNQKMTEEQAARLQNLFSSGTITKKLYNGVKTLNYRYYMATPENENSKLPLFVFLHGSGERGSDNKAQMKFLEILFPDSGIFNRFPAYYLVPQCPNDERWVEVEWDLEFNAMPESPSSWLTLVKNLADSLITAGTVDQNRIYLVGLSMGGFGVWDLISRYPDMFAAAVPICGGGDEKQAAKIVNVPIWAFHGAMDNIVNVNRSRNMINAIIKAGGNPTYTEYPKVGHGSWMNAFVEPGLMSWIFEQNKK